nr:hypothetical protein [uncultured Desulfobacter sp.]
MGNHQELKKFIQLTLGCGCPEEVFNKIDYEKKQGGVWDGRINVGDRLLVYIVHLDSDDDLTNTIALAMESGVAERNTKKFNRFRLVLVTSNHRRLSKSAEKTFCESKLFDEKTHLHLLSQQEIQAID